MMAIIEGRDPDTVDNYGANPSADLPPAGRGGGLPTPKTSDDGIEKPARKISMISEPPVAPQRPEEPEAEDATPADPSGSGTEDGTEENT